MTAGAHDVPAHGGGRGILRRRTADKRFQVDRRAPSPDLADLAEYLWILTWDLPGGEPHTQQVLTRPTVNMTFRPAAGPGSSASYVTCSARRSRAGAGSSAWASGRAASGPSSAARSRPSPTGSRPSRRSSAADRAGAGTGVDWAVLSAELGYADQAHFTRDFSRVIGISPAQYARDC